jgi:hypothetical protein
MSQTAPFPRGSTWYGGATPDTSNYGVSTKVEGVEVWFDNTVPGASPNNVRTIRNAKKVKCRAVRNVSGVNLLPGFAVVCQTTIRTRVDGYSITDFGTVAGVVDDHLPTAGVVNGDIFWLIVQGECLMKTGKSADVTNVWTAGDNVIALAAAASTHSTTAGRVVPFIATSNATFIGSAAINRIGKALSAKTTANTNADLLVDVFLA